MDANELMTMDQEDLSEMFWARAIKDDLGELVQAAKQALGDEKVAERVHRALVMAIAMIPDRLAVDQEGGSRALAAISGACLELGAKSAMGSMGNLVYRLACNKGNGTLPSEDSMGSALVALARLKPSFLSYDGWVRIALGHPHLIRLAAEQLDAAREETLDVINSAFRGFPGMSDEDARALVSKMAALLGPGKIRIAAARLQEKDMRRLRAMLRKATSAAFMSTFDREPGKVKDLLLDVSMLMAKREMVPGRTR